MNRRQVFALVGCLMLIALVASCAKRERFKRFEGVEPSGVLQPGTFARLDRELAALDRAGIIGGGSVAIWARGAIVYTNQFGHVIPDDPKSPRVQTDTWFDLASLAKPIAGYPMAGEITASQPALRSVVRAILEHRTTCDDAERMPAALEARSAAALLQSIDLCLDKKPSDSDIYQYSNLSWASLGLLHGQALVEVQRDMRRVHWWPVGAVGLIWTPEIEGTVASGLDREDGWVRGRPFDPLADLMLRGLQTPPVHSGLFGTARDVALIGGAMLEGTGAYAEILSDPARRRDAETGRSIWVTKGGLISPDAPPLGPGTGRPGRVFHQTGYTGTLLWLDNEGDIALAYLTNAAATDALATFDRSAARLVMILLQGQLQ